MAQRTDTDDVTGLTTDELIDQASEGDVVRIHDDIDANEELWTIDSINDTGRRVHVRLVEPGSPGNIAGSYTDEYHTVTLTDETVEHCEAAHPMYREQFGRTVPCRKHASHVGEHSGKDGNTTVTWDGEQ